MRLQPHQLDEPLEAVATTDGDSTASIDTWLNVVSRLMHLPEATRREICSELREHLRERVRDLLLSGSDERAAVRAAIDELGEAAHLARRFEAANRPQPRRLVMHAILILAGAGTLTAGVMTFTNSRDDGAEPHAASRYAPAPLQEEQPSALAKVRFTLADETPLRDAVLALVEHASVGLIVDWGALEEAGINPDQPLGLSFKDLPAPRALTLIAETAGGRINSLNAIDWRVREGELIQFGLRHDLDAREIELITYDITDNMTMISQQFDLPMEEVSRQIMSLLAELVEPINWRDNGGALAQMRLVGGRLFIEAPSRMHVKVQWILDQLPNGQDGHAKANADAEVAGERPAVPLLSDIPILNQYFARLDSVSELSDAKAALEQARDESHMAHLHYRATSPQCEEAAIKVQAAEARYDRLLQEHQSRLDSQSSDVIAHVLNPGDTVTVNIFELYQPTVWASATRTIGEDGMLRVAEIGDIHAAGESVEQLKTEIVRALKELAKAGKEPKVKIVLEGDRPDAD